MGVTSMMIGPHLNLNDPWVDLNPVTGDRAVIMLIGCTILSTVSLIYIVRKVASKVILKNPNMLIVKTPLFNLFGRKYKMPDDFILTETKLFEKNPIITTKRVSYILHNKGKFTKRELIYEKIFVKTEVV